MRAVSGIHVRISGEDELELTWKALWGILLMRYFCDLFHNTLAPPIT